MFPFDDIKLNGEFKYRNRTLEVDGFYDGNGIYKIRFLPAKEGIWTYTISSNCKELDKIQGEFQCIAPESGVHGVVGVAFSLEGRFAATAAFDGEATVGVRFGEMPPNALARARDEHDRALRHRFARRAHGVLPSLSVVRM